MDPKSAARLRDLETRTRSLAEDAAISELRVPVLTLLAHPDLRRIGERAPLAALAAGQEIGLSRLEPLFGPPAGGRGRPLGDPHLSRRPLLLSPLPGSGVRLRIAESRAKVEADGVPVDASRDFSASDLERGTILLISQRITLLLHYIAPQTRDELPSFDLVGESAALVELRRKIARVADLDVSVLLRGETGTGKELVAQALHRASARRSCPFIAVNMGAIPPTLATAELFGASRGAFTGADRRRRGHFARADGGTLFLDEIGETPPEVQVLLLRALENRTIQPVGDERAQPVDVRVLAATDAHLEDAIEAGHFRAPLLHRLSGYEIRLPPLRHRRDDIGRLLMHFLRSELQALDELWRLEAGGDLPWLPAPLVATLAAWSWPGNVRQLRNVARQLVIGNRGAAQLAMTPEIDSLLASDLPSPDPAALPKKDTSGRHTPADRPVPTDKTAIKTLLGIEWADRGSLARQLQERQAAARIRQHQQAARSLLAEHDGVEISGSESRILLFDRPRDAVAYALEYHMLVGETARDLGVELRARASVYLGEIRLHHNPPEAVGRGARPIEIDEPSRRASARLTSLAAPSQTLLNRGAFELAKQTFDGGSIASQAEIRWLEHGAYQFAGSTEAVEVFEVGPLGIAPLSAPSATPDAHPATRAASSPAAEPSSPGRAGGRYRNPREVEEAELLEALRKHRFRLQPTAAALGISRTSLYALIDRSPHIRKARDLRRQEIESAAEDCGGDLDAMAAKLEVSRKGLRRRMTQLGLK